jgi:Raf kinase inhibitor-like YbhB/YbcL family protein
MKMKLLSGIFTGFALILASRNSASAQSSPTPPPAKITVTSSAFQTGGMMAAQFTCKGANINPPLVIQGVPDGTQSLALIVDDPDAPGALFTHWLIWNVDPAAKQIGERSLPAGAIQGLNDFGTARYSGPCPSSGTHRYFFRVFALDGMLELKSGAKRIEVDKAMAGHILARGELMARFSP